MEDPSLGAFLYAWHPLALTKITTPDSSATKDMHHSCENLNPEDSLTVMDIDEGEAEMDLYADLGGIDVAETVDDVSLYHQP
jgi:hypothetical protein